jgi:predicted transcriptional regulator
VDEEVDEKVVLLTEYHDLFTDKINVKTEKKVKAQKKEDEDVAGGKAIRDAALRSVKSVKAPDDSKFNLQAYLQANQRIKERDADVEVEVKKRKLDLEERQVALQEKTLELQQQTIAMFAAVLNKLNA